MERLLVLVPFVLGLVGCSSIGGLIGTPAAADQDICQLLTTAEVTSTWGWDEVTASSEQGQRGPTCGYDDKDGTTIIRLNLEPVGAVPCDQLKDSPNSQAIDGAGDWAYWSDDRQKAYAKKGDLCLEVIPGTGVGDQDMDFMTQLTALTRLAVGRL